MKNDTTFVRMRSGDHRGYAKCRTLNLAPLNLTFFFFWTPLEAILVIFGRRACGSRGAVVSAALSERKVAGSIPTIGDFHTVGPCKKAVFACLATDVK